MKLKISGATIHNLEGISIQEYKLENSKNFLDITYSYNYNGVLKIDNTKIENKEVIINIE